MGTELKLKDLSDTQLYEKQNDLIRKMRMLHSRGHNTSQAYGQCLWWMSQIEAEIAERTMEEEESGVVATIGEDDPETSENE